MTTGREVNDMSDRHPIGADVIVLGAGSLGSAIGGTLAAGGMDVVLVSRRADHVEAIEREGLRMIGDVERVVPLRARASCAGLAPAEVLVVLTKAKDTAAAIASAREAIGPDTLVLTLQNGLGNEDLLAAAVGAQRVVTGRTWIGGQLVGPGQVLARVVGKQTIVGECDDRPSARIDALAAAWTAAGVPTETSDRMTSVIWDKLLTNVATGALAAVTGLGYGDLYAVPELAATGQAAVREAMAVAAAAGVRLGATDPAAVWAGAGAGLPADFQTSMLQSLVAGSVTEVDVVNGAVCRLGARLGVPTPVNDTLVAAVKGRERAVTARRACETTS